MTGPGGRHTACLFWRSWRLSGRSLCQSQAAVWTDICSSGRWGRKHHFHKDTCCYKRQKTSDCFFFCQLVEVLLAINLELNHRPWFILLFLCVLLVDRPISWSPLKVSNMSCQMHCLWVEIVSMSCPFSRTQPQKYAFQIDLPVPPSVQEYCNINNNCNNSSTDGSIDLLPSLIWSFRLFVFFRSLGSIQYHWNAQSAPLGFYHLETC